MAYFRDSGKQIFYICDPLFFPFVNCARDPPCTALIEQDRL